MLTDVRKAKFGAGPRREHEPVTHQGRRADAGLHAGCPPPLMGQRAALRPA